VKIQFLGAARQVTGSRYYLHADGARLLVDCGMFQERQYLERNWNPSPVPPDQIDAVILTHAHLDHCGLIPKLVHEGFAGPVWTTAPTVDLAELILCDSAEIQMEDVTYKRKRHRKEGRRGKHPEVPLYTLRDVARAMRRFRAVGYLEPVKINDHASVVFHDAGHILGSSMVEVRVEDNGSPRRVIFSGDVGQWDKPIVRDPSVFDEADFVIMESTYGDRDHPDRGDIQTQLAEVINRTIGGGGNVVIPTFAVERAQELIYHLSQLLRDNRIYEVPAFLDSPMAADVTDVFRQHRDYFDEEAWNMIAAGDSPLRFPELSMPRTVEESKGINRLKQPAIIMATSGMCTAGRIKHHLVHNISRPECTILFVGYQARGTLGRQILDGAEEVRIHGRQWRVKARVEQIAGFSGHADRRGLLRWLGALKKPPRQLILTHGEEEATLSLAEQVRRNLDWPVAVPEYQQTITLE